MKQKLSSGHAVCCMVFNALFLTLFQLYRGGQCTYPCFPGIIFTSILHNILSQPLVAFLHNHCRNNGQRLERTESCRNDYHQSWKRIMIEPGDRTSDLLFLSLVRYRLIYGPCSVKRGLDAFAKSID